MGRNLITWPETLCESPNIAMSRTEGHLIVLDNRSVAGNSIYEYDVYQNGERIGKIHFDGHPVTDFLWHMGCLYVLSTGDQSVHVFDFARGLTRRVPLAHTRRSGVNAPPRIYDDYEGEFVRHFPSDVRYTHEPFVDATLTMYRSNVAVIITRKVSYSIMVFYGGIQNLGWKCKTIKVNGKILTRRQHRKDKMFSAIGITGVPHAMCSFALVNQRSVTLYDNPEGPFWEFQPTDVDKMALESYHWFLANQQRRLSMHVSMWDWNMMAKIGQGTVQCKYSWNRDVAVCDTDWIELYWDDEKVEPTDIVELVPDEGVQYKLTLKALRKLSDVEVRSRTHLHAEVPHGHRSVYGIPFMKKDDTVDLYFSPVMHMPGSTLQKIIEKLNIRIRASVW